MPGERSITWFPGHMRQAMSAMMRVIKGVDLVLEVRDARVPLSSSNPELSALFKQKRHILVLNKSDLVPSKLHKAAVAQLQQSGLKVMSASCSSAAGVQQVLHAALGWLQRERSASEMSIVMVVGLPNSGKSSLINAFKLAANKRGILAGEQAYQKKAKVGLTPGLTRQVAGFQVSAQPCVYVLDTPGIMVPAVQNDEVGFRLALAGAIKDSVVGEEPIARYMLQFLGRDARQALRAVRASGPLGPVAGRRGTGTGPKWDPEVIRMRTCLYKVLGGMHAAYTPMADQHNQADWHPAAGDALGGVDSHPLHSDGQGHYTNSFASSRLPPWVQSDSAEDLSAEEVELQAALQRYDQLIDCMGVASVRNPSKEQGAVIRLLRAFREGHLGKFMFDTLHV